ncbi:MAG: NADAR family protein [bacterium]
MESIKFYEGEYYLLSNFSAHRVIYQGEEYQTAEHAYQVAKFEDTTVKNKIKNAPSAFLARELGQTKEGRFKNWEDYKLVAMKEIMKAKLLQHKDVREILKSTGEAIIIKNHPNDYFWGAGADGAGKNMMGIIWMELRMEI